MRLTKTEMRVLSVVFDGETFGRLVLWKRMREKGWLVGFLAIGRAVKRLERRGLILRLDPSNSSSTKVVFKLKQQVPSISSTAVEASTYENVVRFIAYWPYVPGRNIAVDINRGHSAINRCKRRSNRINGNQQCRGFAVAAIVG